MTKFSPFAKVLLIFNTLSTKDMALTGKREILKHSGAIQTSGEASLLERKTWNILLLNAFDDLKKKDRFEVSISDLCRWLRLSTQVSLGRKRKSCTAR